MPENNGDNEITIINREKWEKIAEENGYFAHFIETGLIVAQKREEYRKNGIPFSFHAREFFITYKFINENEVQILSMVHQNNVFERDNFDIQNKF